MNDDKLTKQPLIDYYVTFAVIQLGGYIPSDCAEITFINSGTANVVINSALTLVPGQSLSIQGNNFEIDRTSYQIAFAQTGISSLTYIRKFYK